MHIPLARLQTLPTRQRRQAIHQQFLGDIHALLLEHLRQSLLLAFRRGRDQRLAAGLANQLDLGGGRAADRQQGHRGGLVDDAQPRVVAARVALPVGVVGDVTGGDGHRVVVEGRIVAAGCGPPEMRVEGHAVGAVRVDGEGAPDALPDARGLEGLFLEGAMSVTPGESVVLVVGMGSVGLRLRWAERRLRRLWPPAWRP